MVTQPQDATRWPVVFIALLAGVFAAMQIGKASATLPDLRDTFGLGVADASLYLSMFSVGAAAFGVGFGLLTRRIGARTIGVIGLSLVGLGSLSGSFAETWTMLLVARLVEAAGLPFVVSAMPALIQDHSKGRDRVVSMGLWSAWLPLGIALTMMIFLLAFDASDWRGLFRVCGALPLVVAAVLFVLVPPQCGVLAETPQARWTDLRPTKATLAVAMLFALLSASYLTVQGFLPSIAIDALSMSDGNGIRLGAFTALLVIAGNLAAMLLMARGVTAVRLCTAAFLAMGVFGFFLLTETFSPVGRVWAGCLFTACAGVPPGVIWSLVPRLSEGSGAALTSSILYQFAGAGQLLGPIMAGFAVQAMGGWWGAAIVTTFCSVAALGILWRVQIPE